MRRRRAQEEAPPVAVVHRAAALLLDYPGEELLEHLPVLRAALAGFPEELAAPLLRLAEHLAAGPLGELQADYVETFDTRRRCALHLTYYAHGETRRRGPALVAVQETYRAAGFEVEGELPDHLCVLLEFAAREPAVGRALLLEHRAGLEILRLALLDRGSPWADALVAVCATLPPLAGDDRQAVARLAAQGPPDEQVGLEPYAPVTAPPPGGPVPVRLITRPEGALR